MVKYFIISVLKSNMERIEELKERGNGHMKSKPPDYGKAIAAYTEALSIDANSHMILSNRSLAYFKLKRYDDALADAERAVSASPKWPKGILRKCCALNALQKSQEAQEAAQQGFILMHSESFCREFVMQWLKASQTMYSNDRLPLLLPPGPAELCRVMLRGAAISGSFIPDGLTVISDAYWRVLFFCMAGKVSPMLAVTHEAIGQYMGIISDEFERIMSLFGHNVGTVVKEWTSLVAEAMDADLLRQNKAKATKVTENLVEFLTNNIHPALHAILIPLLLLAVTVVNSRLFVLNGSNTGFYSICHMVSMCVPLFEVSPLKAPEYVCHHMNVLAGLIDSYNRRATCLTHEDCLVLTSQCKKMESLLPNLASHFPKAYEQLHEPFEYIIGSAKTAILSKNAGVTIPFQSNASEDPLKNAEKQRKVILEKAVELVTISDAEQLIRCAGRYKKVSWFGKFSV